MAPLALLVLDFLCVKEFFLLMLSNKTKHKKEHNVLLPLYLNRFRRKPATTSLIGLSPLSTTHPRLFQQTWVRSSNTFYRTFNLVIDRSLGFGSNKYN